MKLNRLCIAAALIFFTLAFSSCSTTGDKSAAEGKELYNNGSWSEALERFSDAEAKGVKTFKEAELYCSIGNCYYHLEDYDKCIEYQHKCLDVDPEYFSAWVSLGVAYRKTDNDDKAMTCYECALGMDPHNSESGLLYLSLGNLYIDKCKPISAIEYLEQAANFYAGDNESSTVYAYLAIAYKMALEPEKSAEAFQRAKELGYPRMAEIQESLDRLD